MLEFLSTFAGALVHALGQAAPYVVIGFLIAGIVREFIPATTLAHHFGERGVAPVAKATGTGALIPVCSCGVIPIGVGAFHAGASRGTVLAFLVAAPALSPVAAVLAFQMLGASLALSLIVGVVVGAFALGLVANRMLGGSRETRFRRQRGLDRASIAAAQPEAQPALRRRLSRMMHWSYLDFGAKLGAQLLLGLVLAALIIALIPPDWVQGWLGHQSIWTVLVVLLVAIPIYTCSVPSIAVVYSLLLLGMSPGAAVAFLIAGPATNLAELNAVRGQLGAATAGLYLFGLVAVAVTAGVLTDQVVFPDYQYRMSVVEGEMVVESCCVPISGSTETISRSVEEMAQQVPAWHYPFLAVLVPMMLLGLVQHLRGNGHTHAHAGSSCCDKEARKGEASGSQGKHNSCCGTVTSAGADAEDAQRGAEEAMPRYRPDNDDNNDDSTKERT